MSPNDQIELRRMRRKKKSNSTMKDVADLAGVSVSTVSHVINGTRYVEDSTKDKVLSCIAELKYSPNIIAQRLNGLNLKTIGVLVSNLQGSFFHRLVSSLSTLANKNEYDLLVCDSAENTELEKRHINTLLKKGIDGLIFAPVDHKTHYAELDQRTVPFVQVDRVSDSCKSDYIGINNYLQAQLITRTLIERGCRRIGFVRTEGSRYRGERLSGYYQSCNDAGIYDEALIIRVSTDSSNEKEILEWYREQSPVDAVICSNADICYKVLHSLGRHLTTESSTVIFSFDNNKWFNLLQFPLLSLDQPIELIGRMAFETLLSRIEGNDDPFKKIFVDCDIVNL